MSVRRLVPLIALVLVQSAAASHTPAPTSVTIAGSLQSELGCPGDWQPGCTATHLANDGNDDVWQGTFTVPAGNWEYKAPLNDSWGENYGRGGIRDGANIGLVTASAGAVKFYYDHKSHWITDNRTSTIAVAPGSFQSELGCSGDWDPGCLRSWLQDLDGDGVYSFETTALARGSYEAKVALNESWDVNYGQGGVQNGPNIPFIVPTAGAKVTFRYEAASHVLTILAGHAQDGNVEWDGLRHDSRLTLYRTPGGAVPAGTPVKLRFRTFHNDVTSVKARLFDVNANAQSIRPMELVARDVSCYSASLASESCDYWQLTLPNGAANNLWYRFVVSDGTDTDYYADNTPALDGGLGATSDDPVDNSYALTVYEPGFTTPAWSHTALIYQIFPDRFRNGNPGNDAVPGAADKRRLSKDPRYAYPNGDPSDPNAKPEWDQAVQMLWNELPEGYCRNYAAGECPQRFAQPSAAREGPRGRDYFGGDLKGVTDKLDYLKQLGVTAIYFNPIFDGASNHGYDTQDYTRIDPYFGTLDQFQKLRQESERRGIRLVLDGVFNHMSSDSPRFDRYRHYADVGACESLASPFRDWFAFTSADVPCGDGDYEGWFGFGSIPVLRKTNSAVRNTFVEAQDSIAGLWLQRGAGGWRFDVSGDPSFPAGYWEAFRSTVKQAFPDSLAISETWQKDTTLLRILRGDRLDTTMNYRLRDAVIGLLSPGSFDSKGFADSGRVIAPSEFAARIESIREDYAPAAYASLMNLLDSHDTERLLWALTPGAETRAERESPANLAVGKQRVRLASLIQFTMPGAPTVYYGDEVGLTGDDDPDDRRPYPWADLGGNPDQALLQYYTTLASLRRANASLARGDLRVLFADDASGTLAYGRKTSNQAAIVAVNRSNSSHTLQIPVAGYVPEETAFSSRLGGSGGATVSGGTLVVTVAPRSGAVLLTGSIDLEPPGAPTGLKVTGEGNGTVGLSWNTVSGAASYNVYRSPVSGGGYVKANGSPVTGTSFTDTALRNARTFYYVVRAVDGPGNESGDSNEVSALPRLTIGWANLQWPPTLNHTISAVNRTDNVYGQVWVDGVTNKPGPTESLRAELGFGPDGSNPAGNSEWTWAEAVFNVDAGNNDEFVARTLPDRTGVFDYAYRYSTTDGLDWVYADLDGIGNGYGPAQAGSLTVNPSSDTTRPAVPSGLHVVSASPAGIELAWNAVSGDPSLYGYEVLRGGSFGARVTGTSYTDTDVVEGQTYSYVVRSVDTSFNRSGNSSEVSARAELRKVSFVVNVTVPASTDSTRRSVYVAGTLDRLDGGLPQWNPGGVVLTRVDATHWRIAFSGTEATQLEYKYTLGDWEHVEKGAACDEIANRELTLSFGSSGTQTVVDTVLNWRNVAPCGN
ncbi:MAG TPA: alpha-amylase family glycosyl hydrolase [Gaiellaceae bacterium]|jgi:glycosidase|nr:alpha-amylase family glycosyl hydrolase [Gaiellaceae bacterium]